MLEAEDRGAIHQVPSSGVLPFGCKPLPQSGIGSEGGKGGYAVSGILSFSDMQTGVDKFYLRLYAPADPRSHRGYLELILPSAELVRRIKGHVSVDAVLMSNGVVARHDYKKPLPQWLSDDLIRQMVITTGKLPPNGVDPKP